MALSYDDMVGQETDPADHPATSMPQATQHYAGNVSPLIRPANDNKNLDLGTGGMSEKQINDSWSGLAKKIGVRPTLVPK